jgi:hypothetical protein
MSSLPIPSPIAVIPVTLPNGSAPTLGAGAAVQPAPQAPAAQPQLPPPPKAAAPTGSITGDTDRFIETQILAALAARHACKELAKRLLGSGHAIDTLVINNGIDKTAIANYKSITVLLSAIHTAYLNMIKEAETALRLPLTQVPLPAISAEASSALLSLAGTLAGLSLSSMALPALTTGVQSIASFVNLFRTDTEFKNQQVSVNEQMVVTLLVPYVLRPEVNKGTDCGGKSGVNTIYYPSLYPMDEMSPTGDGALMKLITQLLEDQANGDGRSAECKNVLNELVIRQQDLGNAIAVLKNQLETATEAAIRSSINNQINLKLSEHLPIKEKIIRLRESSSNLDALKANTTSFTALLTNIDTATQMTLLGQLLRVERLQATLSTDDTYVLDLTVTATGTTRIRRNMFFNAKAAHSGGVTISARLFNNKGALVTGEVVNNYIGFTDSQQIRELAAYESPARDRGDAG